MRRSVTEVRHTEPITATHAQRCNHVHVLTLNLWHAQLGRSSPYVNDRKVIG